MWMKLKILLMLCLFLIPIAVSAQIGLDKEYYTPEEQISVKVIADFNQADKLTLTLVSSDGKSPTPRIISKKLNDYLKNQESLFFEFPSNSLTYDGRYYVYVQIYRNGNQISSMRSEPFYIKSGYKQSKIDVILCEEKTCMKKVVNPKVGQRIYVSSNSNIPTFGLDSVIITPNGRKEELTLNEFYKVTRSGEYRIQITPTLAKYESITKQIEFDVLSNGKGRVITEPYGYGQPSSGSGSLIGKIKNMFGGITGRIISFFRF
jgi:hypothetical protein